MKNKSNYKEFFPEDLNWVEIDKNLIEGNPSNGNGDLTIYWDLLQVDKRYEGEIKNYKPHGKGIAFDENGNVIYSGEYIDGKRTGYGELFNNKGVLIYRGQFENNEIIDKDLLNKFDKIKLRFTKGKYKEVKTLKPSSFNTQVGHGYVGQVGLGLVKHGFGINNTYSWKEIIKTYEGEWNNGFKSGYGIEKKPDKNWIVYEGDWIEDRYHGFGIYYHQPNQKSYEGNWLLGKRNGHGKSFQKNGVIHVEGDWENDKPIFGKIFSSKGILQYEGQIIVETYINEKNKIIVESFKNDQKNRFDKLISDIPSLKENTKIKSLFESETIEKSFSETIYLPHGKGKFYDDKKNIIYEGFVDKGKPLRNNPYKLIKKYKNKFILLIIILCVLILPNYIYFINDKNKIIQESCNKLGFIDTYKDKCLSLTNEQKKKLLIVKYINDNLNYFFQKLKNKEDYNKKLIKYNRPTRNDLIKTTIEDLKLNGKEGIVYEVEGYLWGNAESSYLILNNNDSHENFLGSNLILIPDDSPFKLIKLLKECNFLDFDMCKGKFSIKFEKCEMFIDDECVIDNRKYFLESVSFDEFNILNEIHSIETDQYFCEFYLSVIKDVLYKTDYVNDYFKKDSDELDIIIKKKYKELCQDNMWDNSIKLLNESLSNGDFNHNKNLIKTDYLVQK